MDDSLGLRTIDYILLIVGFIGTLLGCLKANKDYQDRKLAETAVKAKENSVGAEQLKRLTEEIKRLERKIEEVDNHCDERDKQQRENVSNFFQQTWNLINMR